MMARAGRDAAALVHPHPADLQGNRARYHKQVIEELDAASLFSDKTSPGL
jgi:hypothetical protein